MRCRAHSVDKHCQRLLPGYKDLLCPLSKMRQMIEGGIINCPGFIDILRGGSQFVLPDPIFSIHKRCWEEGSLAETNGQELTCHRTGFKGIIVVDDVSRQLSGMATGSAQTVRVGHDRAPIWRHRGRSRGPRKAIDSG